MDPPESLEQIFLRVEEESQRRADADDGIQELEILEGKNTVEALAKTAPIDVQKLTVKARRRGSVSITRFGQLADEITSKEASVTSPPNSPATFITTLASQSTFYQSQLLNTSHDSLDSHASENEGLHAEDDNHVTQVQTIPARQTLSRTVGALLPRRLSRARSRPVMREIDGTMVIGVSVQAATATIDGESRVPPATVTVGNSDSLTPSLNSKASKASLRSISSTSNRVSNSNWVTKAKGFTKKLRRKSGQPLTQTTTT
jgi:hypothetical protein